MNKRRYHSRELDILAEQRALLAALSDDLALPLIQIKTSVELIGQGNAQKNKQQLEAIALSSQSGLQLIEAYRLALHASQNADMPMQPVAVGALLQDAAHQLSDYAKRYDTELQIDVQGRLTPVLAHGPSLLAVLQILGSSLIRAQAAQAHQKKYKLLLGAHRSADDVISTGVFSDVTGLSDKALRAARGLVGKARQPLPAIPPGAASGVLIADVLCTAMWQPLRSAAHRNLGGLATAVPISKQLHFV